MNSLPPVEKIYEAYSAIVDKRITMTDEQAIVRSSDGAKEYTVTWNGDTYTSNDNATYWQGYAGYPVLAVLMLQDRLPFDRETASLFSGVNWTILNKKHKQNYTAAVRELLQNTKADPRAVTAVAEGVLEAVKKLPITIKRGSLRPPKRNS